MKKLITPLLALCIFLSACTSGKIDPSDVTYESTTAVTVTAPEQPSHRDPAVIVRELVEAYSSGDEDSEMRTAGLLDELRQADPLSASRWERVLVLWKTADNDLVINPDVLPDGLPDTGELCLVVLGFQLNSDGTMREELLERLRVALASAEKYPNAYIACTGGPTASQDRSVTEAGSMAQWLIENGVDPDRIIIEDQSLTTAQNALFTNRILADSYPEVRYLAIISSDYHISTGTLLFGAQPIFAAEDGDTDTLTVISNAAYITSRPPIQTSFQASALLDIAGDSDGAIEMFYG